MVAALPKGAVGSKLVIKENAPNACMEFSVLKRVKGRKTGLKLYAVQFDSEAVPVSLNPALKFPTELVQLLWKLVSN